MRILLGLIGSSIILLSPAWAQFDSGDSGGDSGSGSGGFSGSSISISTVDANGNPLTQAQIQQSAQNQATAIQQSAQAQLNNLIQQAQQNAQQARDPLIEEQSSLQQQLGQCAIDRNQANLDGQQQVDQAKNQAIMAPAQAATQMLPQLFQSGLGSMGGSNSNASADQADAVRRQNNYANIFASNCGNPNMVSALSLRSDGGNQSDVESQAMILARTNQTATPVAGTTGTGGTCNMNDVVAFDSITDSAKKDISDAKKVESAAGANIGSLIAAAAALGVTIWASQTQEASALSEASAGSSLNDETYNQCVSGIQAQNTQLLSQLAEIDSQLSQDIAADEAEFKNLGINNLSATLPDSVLNQTPLTVANSSSLQLDGVTGGTVASDALSDGSNAANSLFSEFSAGVADASGTGGTGAAGSAGAADANAKVPWGFRDPLETSNPGLSQRLADQPGAASYTAGAEGGGAGGGAGNSPFGANFAGFEDAFANVGAEGSADSGGNGFIELAQRTKRRLYAHLNELLGRNTLQPSLVQNSSATDTGPNRKISSLRN